jgi:hypothetical protein
MLVSLAISMNHEKYPHSLGMVPVLKKKKISLSLTEM